MRCPPESSESARPQQDAFADAGALELSVSVEPPEPTCRGKVKRVDLLLGSPGVRTSALWTSVQFG